MLKKKVYIAASFRHIHAVQMLANHLENLDFDVLDWTKKAVVPEGLSPAQRREWMDTDDNGGTVYAFCSNACTTADFVIYLGESGQDAGVEIGMAKAKGIPILGIRGPLEAAGLMLHGSCTLWVDTINNALVVLKQLAKVQANEIHDSLINIKY